MADLLDNAAVIADVDEYVRLKQDIPELGLVCGEVGVVCSTWFSPTPAVEVEFQPRGFSYKTRALLLASQFSKADA
jgi:hypothetical protein